MNKKEERIKIVRIVGSLLIALIAVCAMIFIYPLHIFGGNAIDLITYEVGIILTAGVLELFWWKATVPGYLKGLPRELMCNRNLIRILAFFVAFVRCCDYVSAGSDYAKGISVHIIYISLGVVILTFYEKKELLNIWNYIISGLAIIGLIVSFVMYRGLPEQLTQSVLWIMFLWIWTIIGINIILRIFKKNIRQICVPYAVITVLTFLAIFIFLNHKDWPVRLIIVLVCITLRPMGNMDWKYYLSTMSLGAVMAFLWICLESIIRRPFSNIGNLRYAGMFNTATLTSAYLIFMYVVLLGLWWVYGTKKRDFIGCLLLILLGISGAYQMMTISRVGLYSMILITLLLVCGEWIFGKKRDVKFILVSLMKILASILICFFIIFTATRTITAVINRPIFLEGEWNESAVLRGDSIDSEKYMSATAFYQEWIYRIIGVELDLEGEEVALVGDSERKSGLEGTGFVNEYSSGRFTIYKMAIENIGLDGNEDSGLYLENGVYINHVHNIFLQIAYDHGILAGILFLVFYGFSGIRAIFYYREQQKMEEGNSLNALLPVIVIAAFGIVGMVEWVGRPFVPISFFFWMVLPILAGSPKEKQEVVMLDK